MRGSWSSRELSGRRVGRSRSEYSAGAGFEGRKCIEALDGVDTSTVKAVEFLQCRFKVGVDDRGMQGLLGRA